MVTLPSLGDGKLPNGILGQIYLSTQSFRTSIKLYVPYACERIYKVHTQQLYAERSDVQK